MDNDLEREVNFYGAALAHPVRLQMVSWLSDETEISSGEFATRLGIKWSLCSQHLLFLKRYGVVKSRKDAQWVLYFLARPEYGPLLRGIRRSTKQVLAD